MSEAKKQYRCILPTNSVEPGEIVKLTDAEVANFNGGEPKPRFVPVEDGEPTTMSEENLNEESKPEEGEEKKEESQATPEGEYKPEGGEGEGANTSNPTE